MRSGKAGWILAANAMLAGLALGQDFRASISGTVSDSSGAPIAAAKVKVTNVEKKTESEATTNVTGLYSIQYLLPGHYTVEVEAQGFKRFVRENVDLNINDRFGLDVAMEVGALVESVRVTSQVPLLETESASRGGLVDPQFVENVPNRGRNMFELAFAMPGAYKPSTSQGNEFGIDAIGNATPQINGSAMGTSGRQWNTDVLINGTSNTQGNANLVMTPALAAIQELKVMTNTYDAAYGHTGGGIISVTTKSGSNDLHGQVFDRHFDSALAANSWANNRTGTPKSATSSDTYGFEVDGPILIPKVANLRNKMFFMVSMERTPNNSFSTSTVTVPLPEMLQGNFSNLFAQDGKPITIYDPLTTRPDPAHPGQYIRDPFPGNIIPADRINPVAAKILGYFPAPTGSGVGPAHTNNFTATTINNQLTPQWFGRLDYHLNDNNVFYGEYGETYYTRVGGFTWGDNAADPSAQDPRGVRGRHLTVDYSRTISSTMTFDLRVGFARAENIAGSALSKGFSPSALGFPQSLVSQLPALGFPAISFSNDYASMGAVGYFMGDDTYHLAATVSKVIRTHVVKFGWEERSFRDTTISPGNAPGSYTFSKTWTQANPNQSDTYSGNTIASLLLGYPASGLVQVATNPAWRSSYTVGYVQDDWKLRRSFTLNLGMRYEYESPPVERYNRQGRGVDLDAASPIAQQVAAAPGVVNCAACASLKGSYLFAGSSGAQRYAYNPIKNNFSPRLGFAWQPLGRTVIRGGFGIYKLPVSNPGSFSGSPDGFSRTTPMIVSVDGGLTPSATLSNPFPGGILQPVGSSLGAANDLGLGVSFQDINTKTPTSYQYSFGIQRELPAGFLLDASYVGNLTTHLGVTAPLNVIPASMLGQPASYYTQKVTNPFAGLLPNNSGLNGATIPLQNLLVAYPQYSGLSELNAPIGRNRYDSLQLAVNRRFANGLVFSANYTISKTLEQLQFLNPQDFNPSNPGASELDKRLTPFDVPQKISILGAYDLPYGKSKLWGRSAWRPLQYILGDWRVGWNFTLQEGFPVDFPNAAPLEATSAALPSDQRSMFQWFNTSLFPKVAGPAPFTMRDFPSRFPDVRYQGLRDFDFSVMKDFKVKERLRLQVRADITNAFNTPYFTQMQSLDVTSPVFGQLKLSQNNDPRVVYLEFKVLF